MRLPDIRHTVRLIQELNPGQIQHEAELPCAVLLAGDPARSDRIARALSQGCRSAVHPWITQRRLPLAAPFGPRGRTAALVIGAATDDERSVDDALRQLRAAEIPAATVWLNDALAVGGVSATPVRPGARAVVLPDQPHPTAVQHVLAPLVVDLMPSADGACLALARQLPVLRSPYVAHLIDQVAEANGWYALSTGLADLIPGLGLPLTATDMLVLTKNQLIMAYKIALAAGRQGEPRTLLGEVIGVVGGGLVFRQLARELVGLVPGIGIVPKVAVAYAGTRLIGEVVRAWALEDRRVEVHELRRLYASALAAGRALGEDLVKRAARPRRRLPRPRPVMPATDQSSYGDTI